MVDLRFCIILIEREEHFLCVELESTEITVTVTEIIDRTILPDMIGTSRTFDR